MAKKSRKQQPGGTPATVALTAAGVPFTVHSYDHDPAHPSYGEEAAEAMGVAPDRVFKTLVADVDGALTVAVVPVAGRLDLKALASAAGGKRAAMADPALAERTTGYVRGGISPLGQRKRLPTVVDESATLHDTICVSAGRRGLEVELSPKDLADLTSAHFAPIGRVQPLDGRPDFG
ncbi:Cys-tRNA(Pro) deacylase [Streptomyces sp. CHD11]|uniref:Cys-tRNA(Pro) deacylase n=1 Tax=Streptomyces sp. CHD11 TaxID=2741325 RepID=UPI001BFCC710|nr:Cys-tRNA(Pro) deacylase [Streptomyces sp. CHD11]MBT3149686.1 Cys-tRNA(Pro) deacylase [Streptomyces sp. CHD11]